MNYTNLTEITKGTPTKHYLDISSTKDAMFQLLSTNNHIVQFTKKLKLQTAVLSRRECTARGMVFFEFPISDYASTDYISDIDSNALSMYLCHRDVGPSCSASSDSDFIYTDVDTLITSAMYSSRVPSLMFGFDVLYIPNSIYVTMTMSLVPMALYEKIRNNVSTNLFQFSDGYLHLKNPDKSIITNLMFKRT